jgi:RHS repeat-associated protein
VAFFFARNKHVPPAPEKDRVDNQYTTSPGDRICYDSNGNLICFEPQGGSGMLMGRGLQPGGPAMQAAVGQALNEGDVFGDLTNSQSFDSEDLGVVGELLEGPEGGGAAVMGGSIGLSRLAYLRYDYRNQMVEYEDQTDGTRKHRYLHDCFGRRFGRITDVTGEAFPMRVHRSVHGGQASWQILAEYDGLGTNPSVAATYVYGNSIDEPLSMRRDTNGPAAGGVVDYFYCQDDLFNVTTITDSGGAVVERLKYGDYGFPTITDANGAYLSNESTVGNPFLFTGREWEPEIRFFYYRTRYMEPTWGRFTTRGRIGTWGDATNHGNALTLCSSIPSVGLDPFGLSDEPGWTRVPGSAGKPSRQPGGTPGGMNDAYDFDPDTWQPGQKTKSLDDIIRGIDRNLKNSGNKCVKDLTIAGHGAPGRCQLGDPGPIRTGPQCDFSKGGCNEQTLGKKVHDGLRDIGKRMCPGGTVRIAQCNTVSPGSGGSDSGAAIGKCLASLMLGANVILYRGNTRFAFNTWPGDKRRFVDIPPILMPGTLMPVDLPPGGLSP